MLPPYHPARRTVTGIITRRGVCRQETRKQRGRRGKGHDMTKEQKEQQEREQYEAMIRDMIRRGRES